MDKGGDMSGPAANNSSDFVSPKAGPIPSSLTNFRTGSQVVQVSYQCLMHLDLCLGVMRPAANTPLVECLKILLMKTLFAGERGERVL
jgi:hypothetical protein